MSIRTFNQGRAAATAGLEGVRVAITHAHDQAEEQSRLFERLGAKVFIYPAIEIVPFADNSELDGALREAAAGKYDWLVLNDADTVLVVAQRVQELNLDARQLARLKVATIGCMTEQWTQQMLGLQSSFAPEDYTPEVVASAMRLELGERVLLPQSSMTRLALAKCLRDTGADVTAINAYRTVIGRGGDPVPILLWEGKLDAITFTFPTAVHYFARRIKHEGGSLDMLDDVCVACIGPLTASAARSLGLKVAVVPRDHTIAGLVEATAAYFQQAKA